MGLAERLARSRRNISVTSSQVQFAEDAVDFGPSDAGAEAEAGSAVEITDAEGEPPIRLQFRITSGRVHYPAWFLAAESDANSGPEDDLTLTRVRKVVQGLLQANPVERLRVDEVLNLF